MASLDLQRNRTDPSTVYSIDVYVQNNQHVLTSNPVTVNNVPYYKQSSIVYFVPNMSKTFFNGTVDLDSFMKYCLGIGISQPTDTITNVRLSAKVNDGESTIDLSYSAIYDTLVFMDSGVVGNITGLIVNLQLSLSKLGLADYVEVRTPAIPTQLSDFVTYYNVSSADGTLKSSTEVRVGYYSGTWLTPVGAYGFPLDPSSPVRYFAQDWSSLTMAPSDKLASCWVFETRNDYDESAELFTNPNSSASREVHICPFWPNVTELQGSLIEGFVFEDGIGNSVDMLYYENAINATSIHLFRPKSAQITAEMDLFFFIRKLVKSGKISKDEVLSGLSFRFNVYSGTGSFLLLSLKVPSDPLPFFSNLPGCINGAD